MLSNVEVVLLSIVNEKPSYAYEIDKNIELKEMRRWIRIGVASIYQVLERLKKKDMVYSKEEKEGRMPVRKRYYITASGREALIETSKKLLTDLEWYYLDLNVGLVTSDLLSSEEIADCLTKRLAKVELNIKRLKEMYLEDDAADIKRRIVIDNLIHFREAEKKLLTELLPQMSYSP